MTKLKLHYDGWIALPATVRRRMGITTGDQLEADWVEGGLLLRSPNAGGAVKAEVVEVMPQKSVVKKAAAEPKKNVAVSRPKSMGKLAASTIPKARGRRKAAAS